MKSNTILSIQYFSKSLLRANLRNYKALAVMMGVPVFMLLSFWLPSLAAGPDEPDMMKFMFPTIVLLSVVIAGLTHATRLARWREQDVFRRLVLTPVPLTHMILGASLVQVLMGLLQGVVMLVFGLFVLQLNLNWLGCLIALVVMVLAAAAFIAMGSFIAAIVQKAEIAGYIFMFMLLPLIFLGSFPKDMMPEVMNSITPWLPTSMAVDLIGVLFYSGHLPDKALFDFVGLFGYLLLFTVLSAWKLRWKG